MKKLVLILYFLLSATLILAALIWQTAKEACGGYFNGTSNICYPDGQSNLGILMLAMLIAVLYLLVTMFVMKLLGYKLVKK